MLFFSDVQKRSYPRPVCHEVVKEEFVSTNILVNKSGTFYPYTIQQISCKTEGGQAPGVSDSSIVCKTKEKIIEVFELDGSKIIDLKQVKVPVGCVAYKI
jgi:hypothetical protein